MLHSSTSSPRRGGNCGEGGPSSDMDSARGRNLTPREQFQQRQRTQHHSQAQRARQLYKNLPGELSSYYPPHIQVQDHGRWESSEGYSTFGVPRFGGPRRGGMTEKEAIDLHSLPVLKQPSKNIFHDIDSLSGGDSPISDDKFRAQLRAFPELPQLAHERIREFGNEIVASYPAQMCKFVDEALIETTPNSFAVFTKKNRTGQRWLMVFRTERGRVNISFNKLLTNQLVIRSLNPVSVEVEPAKGLSNTPLETCVFTFNNHTEANKFVHDIHESQTIVWNHREMFLEQTLRGGGPNAVDYYLDGPPNFGYYSPRPLSARSSSSGYYIPHELPPPLTPRMKVLPPAHARSKRSPFTVSQRTTPRSDIDENWRGCCEGLTSVHGSPVADLNAALQGSPTSVTQSPIRKRSKGSSKDSFANAPNSVVGGDGDFVYNSLTHSKALQQNSGSKMGGSSPPSTAMTGEGGHTLEVSTGRRFKVSDVLVSNKRDVGTGAPDEEFFSVGDGDGELQLIDNGDENFDEIKCFTSTGQLMFSQSLFGWNKVRHPEGSQKNPTIRWWIGAAVLGAAAVKGNTTGGGEAPRIREFKATFADEESAIKFSELFQAGAAKGNNPDVKKKYVVQSLRI